MFILRRSRPFALMLVAFLVLSVEGSCVRADEEIAAADELRQLGEEYDRLCKAMYADSSTEPAKYTREVTDKAFLEDYYRECSRPNPDSVMLPRFLAYAKKHSNSPLAFDAIAFVIQQGGPATGALHASPWQCKERAIDIVLMHYMDDQRIGHLFDMLSLSIPSVKTELLLRAGFRQERNSDTRAAAGLALAKYLHHQAPYRQRSSQLKGKVRIDSFFDRHWKLIVTPHLESLEYDRDSVSEEVDTLLNHVATRYSELKAPEFRLSGPGKVLLQSVPQKNHTTYGDLARLLKVRWSEFRPGNKAPELLGKDFDSQEFRLSDHKGKVVLLVFSANWCAPCKRLYPVYRAVVEKFDKDRFVMLSVSRDESVDTLKSSVESGEITWRCWWDGRDGPINEAWGIDGVPAIFLLDHEHVFQEINFHQGSSLEDFSDAIRLLLSKMPAE